LAQDSQLRLWLETNIIDPQVEAELPCIRMNIEEFHGTQVWVTHSCAPPSVVLARRSIEGDGIRSPLVANIIQQVVCHSTLKVLVLKVVGTAITEANPRTTVLKARVGIFCIEAHAE
jgi:hypothetical protein